MNLLACILITFLNVVIVSRYSFVSSVSKSSKGRKSISSKGLVLILVSIVAKQSSLRLEILQTVEIS